MKAICGGCQSNLSLAVDIPLRMNRGLLVVGCPLCRWENIVKTDDQGNVVIITEQEGGKDAAGN